MIEEDHFIPADEAEVINIIDSYPTHSRILGQTFINSTKPSTWRIREYENGLTLLGEPDLQDAIALVKFRTERTYAYSEPAKHATSIMYDRHSELLICPFGTIDGFIKGRQFNDYHLNVAAWDYLHQVNKSSWWIHLDSSSLTSLLVHYCDKDGKQYNSNIYWLLKTVLGNLADAGLGIALTQPPLIIER